MAKSKTVLIIDDSAFARSTLEKALFSRGFLVSTAENGKEGLDLVIKSPPDAILMDVVMPIMDGWETCRRIRAVATERAVPIIIMTHRNSSKEQLQAFEVGADHFMEKPVDTDKLVAAIERLTKSAADGSGSR
jgi:DNA-binding response OmpR family regulator